MVNRIQHFFTWLFTGKRVPLDEECRLRCGRCRTLMRPVTREDITIDICPNCNGMFLDDGEIGKLLKLQKGK